MSGTELAILRDVFGFRLGDQYYAPLRFTYCAFDRRINNAVEKLKKTGLIMVKPIAGERMYEVVRAMEEPDE